MGIMDFIKSGVSEMAIARPPSAQNQIVYKHADPTIPMYSQLTVNADEAAVFFRDGAVVGALRTAGVGQRHTLDSQNIPFLSNVVDKFTQGRIFTTDLFFVTMRPVYNVQFGGELGAIEDPLLGEMVSPRIFGTFSFQIIDPMTFILKYAGIRRSDDNEELLRWIKGLFMNSVKTVMGEVAVVQQKSMLEMLPLQQQLAQLFMQRAPDLNAIGCAITQVGQFNLNLNDDDMGRLQDAQAEIGAAKRRARIAGIGISEAQAMAQQRQFQLDQEFANRQRHVQQLAGPGLTNYAAAEAMIGAGQGMAQGGGAGGNAMIAGAGLGVGFGMANAMGNMAQGGQQYGGQQQGQYGGAPAPQAPPIRDEVRLTNGGILRGVIVENVPGQGVAIMTLTGEVKRFPANEVTYAGPIGG